MGKNRKSSARIDIGKIDPKNQTADEITPSKGSIPTGQKEVLEEMVSRLNGICRELNSKECEIEEVYDLLKNYNKEYHRVLYSAVSDYIFDAMKNADLKKGEDKNLLLQYRIADLLSFANNNGDETMQQLVIKLYDHITLATRQYISLKQSEEEYKEKFKANIEPVKNDLIKESNSQLLTLVGMFTALAFLIFGGISSLDNLFSEMNNLSMLKLIALGCVWGMCILNLIFVFLLCVSKMTHLPFGFSDKPDAGIREKYTIVWLSNLILLTLLLFSMGFLYIDKYGLNEWFVNWTKSNPILFFVVFFLLLGVVFVTGIFLIFRKKKD